MTASPPLTEQQAAAICCRDASVALSAGAGCGKTTVLTQRFLSHLEPGPDQAELRKLVAITFTDRAAREMRDRIRAACQARLGECPAEAVEHWLEILRGLDSARISTIHSFCTSLLRSHAVEAGIDPRFDVLEPALADTLLQTTTAEVVHRLLIANDPDAVAYVLRFGLDRTRELAASLARQRFRVDWSAWETTTTEELADRWQQSLLSKLSPRLQRQFRSSFTARRVQELLNDHEPNHKEMRQRCAELKARLKPTYVWTNPLDELAALHAAARIQGGGGKSVWSSEDVFEQVKDALAEFRDEVKRLQEQLTVKSDDVLIAAEMSVQGTRLARQVATAYDSAKLAAGALDFDDLLLRARDLLRTREDVRLRFARGIALLLVDEFQDTDPVQAEIVRHLCGAALATGRLFLVGDFKQSIYRFRRADPGVFETIKAELPLAGRLSLTTNFRSQPEILWFVNLLFGPTFETYEPLTTPAKQLSPRPTIEFLWANSNRHASSAVSQKEETLDVSVDTKNEENSADGTRSVPATIEETPLLRASVYELRECEADWIARRIANLLSDETPRIRTKRETNGDVELRRVQSGDIVVLFRALTNVQVYEAALRNYGIDYYLVGGKAFYAQQEVFDLLNLCRCLDEPADAVALVGLLRSPFFGLTDDAVHALRPPDGDWWSRLQQPPPSYLPEFQQERIHFASRVLADLRQRKDRGSIASLLTSAIEQTGYDAALLAEHLGRRKVANLRKLIDQAAVFDRSELFTLKDFVQRLQTSVLEETDEEFATTLPEAGDVIRLMSVHQAKGLEFPVVVVADVDRKPHLGTSGAYLHGEWGALIPIPKEFGIEREHLGWRMSHLQEADENEHESRRLFYVAVTRAADHLILSAGIDLGRAPQSPWMQLLSERFALDTGLPKHDPLLGVMSGAKHRTEIPEILVHRRPPDAGQVRGTRAHQPLETFSENLDAATPEPLPSSANQFTPDSIAPRWWSVSRLEELASVTFPELQGGHGSGTEVSAAESLGTLIHSVLERTEFASPNDWERRLQDCLRGFVAADERQIETARGLLKRFAASELSRRLASAKQLWREVDFALPWPVPGRDCEPDVIGGQIDCCYVSQEGTWHIIDFKTGDYSRARSDADIIAPYRLQLGVYALAAEQWWGRPMDSLDLVIFRPEVRLVTWSFDATARAQVRTWVDRVISE